MYEPVGQPYSEFSTRRRLYRWTRINGRFERSHRTDLQEFYQPLDYVDDVDLNKQLAQWERFCNLTRPYSAFGGQPLMKLSGNVYNRSTDCPTTSCTSQLDIPTTYIKNPDLITRSRRALFTLSKRPRRPAFPLQPTRDEPHRYHGT